MTSRTKICCATVTLRAKHLSCNLCADHDFGRGTARSRGGGVTAKPTDLIYPPGFNPGLSTKPRLHGEGGWYTTSRACQPPRVAGPADPFRHSGCTYPRFTMAILTCPDCGGNRTDASCRERDPRLCPLSHAASR